jgi:hypothetical protein
MATKKTTKPKASSFTKQLATRMDVVAFARLLASSLGNDRWLSEDVVKETFNKSGPAGTIKKDSSKATKIPNLESDSKVMDSLLSIYNLLKTNYEDRLKSDEKKNQFRVEQSLERKKQNEDFIKALGGAGVTNINNTATKVTSTGGGSFLDDLGDLGALGQFAKTLISVARFFTGPVGLAILAATSLAALLGMDKNAEGTTKGILAAGDAGEANRQMMDVVENEGGVVKRRQNFLANRPSAKKRSNIWPFLDSVEIQNNYLKEIGFDEKTGLTEAEKIAGYTGVDDDGNPIMAKPKASPATTPSSEVMASPVDNLSTSSSPVSGAKPSDISESLSPNESIVPAPAAMTSQISSPNVAQKLNSVNSENLDMKLPQAPSDKGMIITNNQKTEGQKGSTKVALPSVRNAEETFQRMILNSTRVV